MTVTAEGLRERKKRKTRASVIEAAIRLFDEQGFEATTVAEIAAEAEIAPRTFFAYFPSKEHVLFHEADLALASLRERLANRRDGESAIDAFRAQIAEVVAEKAHPDARERCRCRLICETESLLDHERALHGRFQEMLAGALREDFGERGELRAEMAAAAAVAILSTLKDREGGPGEKPGDDPMATVDEALIFVRGGMDALVRS